MITCNFVPFILSKTGIPDAVHLGLMFLLYSESEIVARKSSVSDMDFVKNQTNPFYHPKLFPLCAVYGTTFSKIFPYPPTKKGVVALIHFQSQIIQYIEKNIHILEQTKLDTNLHYPPIQRYQNVFLHYGALQML